ncbi:uncharacterized protein LOC143854821 [Tasmannia lanceolata]|uniref:uncharacterized protein LOC143854821 n=1 Tax=Tasmannia lanceolata TaxID=3420 RepID=UPI00406300E7
MGLLTLGHEDLEADDAAPEAPALAGEPYDEGKSTAAEVRGGLVIMEPAPASRAERERPLTRSQAKAPVEAFSSRSSTSPAKPARRPHVAPRAPGRRASRQAAPPTLSEAGPSSIPEYFPAPGWTISTGRGEEIDWAPPTGACRFPIPESVPWIPRHQANNLLLLVGSLKLLVS